MKIGYDAKRAFNNGTGLGNYSRSLITEYARYYQNDELTLFTPKVVDRFANFANSKNIQIHKPSGLAKTFKSLWRSQWLGKVANNKDIEVFHGLSNELPFDIAKQKNIKKIVTIHDLIFLRYPELYKTIDRKIYTKKFKFACNEADTIIAISEQTKQDIMHFFGINQNKIEVIYQDCAPEFSKEISHTALNTVRNTYQLPEKFLLCVGTIEKRKNQELIIKALANIKKDIPLYIVGRATNYKEELDSLITKHQLGKQVRFLQNVPFEDLLSLYRLARIFIYPSIFEGFGIPVIEAQNSGTPVITSNISCLPEAGGKAALLVDPYDVKEMTIAIEKLWTNEDLWIQKINAGFQNVKRFKSDIIIPQIHTLYTR